MKIICQKSDLLNGVNIALKAVSPKSSMTILECLVIDASENGIKLVSNDMELGIETIVKGEPLQLTMSRFFSEQLRQLLLYIILRLFPN